MVLNIVGSISNAIAAVCAVVAIIVTVRNVKSDRQAQKKEKSGYILRELYKQDMIDSMLGTVNERMNYINGILDNMISGSFDENELAELYNNVLSGCHDSLREVEILKYYNQKLCRDAKQKIEGIFDEYSTIIDQARLKKYIRRNFERKPRNDWILLKELIYNCYFNENFDKLDAGIKNISDSYGKSYNT